MSPEVYKLVHIAGILMVFMSLGGLALHAINGGTKDTNTGRRLTAVTYGVGLILILLGGFGWLSASGLMSGGMPGWTWAVYRSRSGKTGPRERPLAPRQTRGWRHSSPAHAA
jgi:hypothetical protein